jgi:Zn-dependent protease
MWLAMSEQGSGSEGRKDPFRAALPMGAIGGIKVRVDLSTAVIFALIAFGLAVWDFPAVNPHQAGLTYAVAAVVTTAVFFASLLAHELAHSLVARRYGLTVNSITLWLFGGVSELGGEAPSPAAEARIAGAGPLTSLLLGGIFIGLAALAGASHPARASIPGVVYSALVYLGVTNVALAVFNVIPAAPLDGGRLHVRPAALTAARGR